MPTLPRYTSLALLMTVCAPLGSAQCSPVEQELRAPDSSAMSGFGAGVAIAGDYLAVGAVGDDEAASNGGALYVFERAGPGFDFQVKLTAADAGTTFHLGRSVAISGARVLAGATHDFLPAQGAVYVFQRTSPTWQQAAKLSASDGAASDRFGWAIDVDGDRAVVGAIGDASQGTATGAAYVFERSGDDWNEVAKLTASDATNGSVFGFDVAVDGDRIVIGSHRHGAAAFLGGAAYVFELGPGGWAETALLTVQGASFAQEAGRGVDLSGDTIAMGVPGHDAGGSDAGAVLVFELQNGIWVQTHELIASDAADGQRLGTSVALDGDALISGSLDDQFGVNAGAVHVFERQGPSWYERGRLGAAALTGDQLGESVALQGDELVAGAEFREAPAMSAGAAFYFGDVLGPVASYCQSAPNSVGGGALLEHAGSTSIGADDLALIVRGAVPGQPGIFYYGGQAANLPFGDGFRCVANGGQPTFRLSPALVPDFVGDAFLALDFHAPPLGAGPGEVTPGSTWYFQFYYRDPAGPGGTGFNFSDGLEVGFCP